MGRRRNTFVISVLIAFFALSVCAFVGVHRFLIESAENNSNQDLGSFIRGTYVTMADGSYQAIEAIQPGDRVLSYDTGSGELADGIVIERRDYPQKTSKYLIINGKASVTKQHKFYVQDAGWVSAASLQSGNRLLTPDLMGEEVASVNPFKGASALDFYDLKIEKYSNYFASGYLVQGLRLKKTQERYIPPEF